MKRNQPVSWFLLFALIFSLHTLPVFSQDDKEEWPLPSSPEDSYSNLGPLSPEGQPAAAPEPTVTTGAVSDRITLELKGVNVLDVLKILAKRSGLNIVAGRDVRGDVTLYMQDVEVRRALDTIVRTLGLAYDEKDGIITVMSHKEFVTRYGKPFQDDRINEVFKLNYASAVNLNQLVQQMKSQIGKIAVDEKTATIVVTDIPEVVNEIRQVVKEFDQPLATKTYTLKYAKAADIGEELKDYLTQNVGVVKIDKRANQITVTDRAAVVDQIIGIIEAFDIRPLQVLIEAKVVEVQLYDAFRFGVNWKFVDLKAGSAKNISLEPAQTVTAPGSSLGSGTLSAFTVGTSVGGDTMQTVINILSNVGKTNILSSPRLLCLNNEEAKLAVATKQPYITQNTVITTAASQVGDDVKFIDVGVTLSIVPTITHDGNVVLKVKPEVSTKGSDFTVTRAAQTGTTTYTNTIPIVTSQSLETTVVVKDGTTVVIGGLIQDKELKTRKKLPILGDIPMLGALFRTETNDFNKTELVIFLTPHIVSGKGKTLEESKFLDREGNFIEFNKVGGYDFTKAEATSPQGPFRMDDKPYYRSLVEERPVYFPPRDTAIRAAAYRGKMNQFGKEETAEERAMVKSETPGIPAPSEQELEEQVPAEPQYASVYHARRRYRETVAAAIRDALALRHDLGRYPLEVELFLVVEKDGGLTLKRVVKDTGLSPNGKALVLDTVSRLSPFPPFPDEMNSGEELLDLKIQLT